MNDLENKKFPIGRFNAPASISDAELEHYTRVIRNFPGKLKNLIEDFTDEQLDTQYREGGWTIRQLINHLADSHANSFIRFKLALTEDNPTIKPYDEARWAELQDSTAISIKPAMRMIKGTHQRWYVLLKTLTNRQFERTFHHPEHQEDHDLRYYLALYVWHCNHHFAHIENLKRDQCW
ncbi:MULTISPECIES: YfiT family bacillithiol transferase [Chryseobacterium]|uniref:Rubrerythrin n=1 Tax=Chryseobacterium camelliae TaxID=1265445 RepID=A0ABU0THF6_9FLAO|nr:MULTISPECIES: putative metal-dependent hydrolase [Chryseobacterium]MDT3405925.1 rubrerythrin [Pseudacidovorax intermedius]MDQ1096271.1 rubrerythrin [Chryseobacterium camelliae]MDQ1100208.1 rubrerythrin [Chryseobacterium sp. SORGH_AS_1048]MDR6087553.1 rubrerythrin [Chryseobacterium sp. SORGH_AS_0909]MDR6131927.1 rubrerythrin [Chryseobacterium sp. SORGH_AS_1175]